MKKYLIIKVVPIKVINQLIFMVIKAIKINMKAEEILIAISIGIKS